jgi:hypothetical protein
MEDRVIFRNLIRLAIACFCWAGCAASGATFQAIQPPVCFDSSFTGFSVGEQYVDANNGVLNDQWSMLVRWQGPNFVSNSVSYDVGQFTNVHSALAQRGVQPEVDFPGGTPAVQVSCLDVGIWINTWGNAHRPIVGGGYNDMWGYKFSNPVRAFTRNGVPTTLVLQSNVAVPYYASTIVNTLGRLATGQVGLFAYLRDATQPAGSHPIVIAAMTHMSNPGTGGTGTFMDQGSATRDYPETLGRNDSLEVYDAWPNWAPYDPNGKGIWFVSAPISSQYQGHRLGTTTPRYPVFTLGSGTTTWDDAMVEHINASAYDGILPPYYRIDITPQNMANIASVLNWISCPSPDDCQNFSTNPNDWYLEYAGVIAEATLTCENTEFSYDRYLASQPVYYDTSPTQWVGAQTNPLYGDHGKDQVTLAAHAYGTGIYRLYPRALTFFMSFLDQ